MGKLLASILFFATLPSFGQNQVRFDRITVEDGLSQSSITSMVQDEFGYLWIGTLDGLNKYDGNNFYKYKSNDNDSTGLPRNEIKNLFLDNTKNVWISTPGYLSKFFEDQNSFINYALFNDGSKHIAPTVYDLNQESDSILILATNTGIWRLNVINKLLKRSHEFDEFDDKVIFNYCSMNNGDTWIVTDENAYLRRNNKMSFKNVFSSKSPLEFYYSQRTDEVYMQTIDSLYKFDSTLKQFFPLFHFSNKNSRPNWQMPMLKLRNGELWVLRNDISIFNSRDHYQETVSFVQEDPFSLSSDYLSSIFETQEGVVWIGTNGMGLNK
ncbi:MAG: two-component regulator propeller domain-containing protein, partial [Fulvivirga sp.]